MRLQRALSFCKRGYPFYVQKLVSHAARPLITLVVSHRIPRFSGSLVHTNNNDDEQSGLDSIENRTTCVSCLQSNSSGGCAVLLLLF